eukprot:15152243-Ditylum_brightwellii.AAC.1
MTMQPTSVSYATDNKACLWRGGTTWPQQACSGSIGRSALHVCDDRTSRPSGMVTVIGVIADWMSVSGLSIQK